MKSRVPYIDTQVSVERSRARVEALLDKFEAEATMVIRRRDGTAQIAFQVRNVPVLLEVDPGLYVKMFRRHHGHSRLGAEQLRAKAERAVWRHLEAKLKARLEEIGHRIGTVPLLAAPEEA